MLPFILTLIVALVERSTRGGNISSKGTPVSISSAYALPPAQSISEGLILNLMAYMELDLDEKFTKCKCKCVIPVRKEKLSLVG